MITAYKISQILFTIILHSMLFETRKIDLSRKWGDARHDFINVINSWYWIKVVIIQLR